MRGARAVIRLRRPQSEKSLAEHRCDRGVKRASKAGKSAKDDVATTDVVATHGLAKAA